jgi:hypothetical protein
MSGTDLYCERETIWPSKYMKAMHKKFHEHIDRKVSVISDTPTISNKNGPQVPNPPKYGGLQDSEEFKRWLGRLLQWLKVNKICGPELDSEQIEFTAMFLEGIVLSWFEDNVDGTYHQRLSWIFKDVITGLYDRFVHDNSTHDASDKFWHVEYNAEEGVMSYYYKLERYTNRMVQAPDPFTFRTQLMAGLPVSIISFVLGKGCSTETGSVDEILFFAHEAEEIERLTKHFREKKRILESSKSKNSGYSTKNSKQKDPSPERSRERSKDHFGSHFNRT